jgi:ABC-2 type transport system permease protein
MFSRLRAIWDARRVLALLISRDLRVRYATSTLGYLWTLLEPLLMAMVFWVIFTKIFARGIGSEPYIVFLLIAYLPYQWVSGVLSAGPKALQSQSKLVRSTRIPREIWVLRAVGSRFVELLLSIPVVAGFMIGLKVSLTWYTLAVPLALLMLFLLLSGAALALAALGVLYRDVRRLVGVINRLLFYLSPIIYGVNDVATRLPEAVGKFYMLNPLAGIIDLLRASAFPEDFYGWWPVAWAGLVSVATFVIGMKVFARLERPVLKEI